MHSLIRRGGAAAGPCPSTGASSLIDTAPGYLLGSEQTITVPGAEHADDDSPIAAEAWNTTRRSRTSRNIGAT
ncbi:hypothetical protein GCM10020367_71070 [Streptomyces sannanensis]|uniref:Uncharacterized protein n=1 Tax=Streptomyces sannanensis TaxID=285536 RepID=A0ABP6SMX6_9ACTN